MTRRVRFTPLLAAGAFAAGLVGVAPPWADSAEIPFSAQQVVSAAGDVPVSVFAADVDGDGDLDLLSASFGDDTIAWHQNDGSQSFTTHTITTAANGANSVVAADVDGDGDMDVLSASFYDDKVAWYENDGSQNFTTNTITTAANGAFALAVADVDRDGDVDVLSASSNDNKVAWYENDGSQNFMTRTITTAAQGARTPFAADVDGDGDIDVLSASSGDDKIAWYENDGSENFTTRTITTAADAAVSVFAADVDGDGDTDVLSVSANDDKVVWYENDGSQSFTTRTITTGANGAFWVFASDMDGDGDTDVLSAAGEGDQLAWYENDGSESFTPRIISSTTDGPFSVFAADVDGDGDTDVLAAAGYDPSVAWYENETIHRNAVFPQQAVIATAANSASSVFATDIDGDGDTDVLSASPGDDRVAWYENDGSQNFTTHTIGTAPFVLSVFAADVDGDGDADVLSASFDDDRLNWFENDGSANFTKHILASLQGPLTLYAADVDGDGDTDAVAGGLGLFGVNRVSWYENDGNQDFTAHIITTAVDRPTSVFATDVDADGDTDILSASSFDDTVAWYENDGSQNFTTRTITTAANNPVSVFVADVDRDGDPDILSASILDDTVAWYENDGSYIFAAHTITTAADSARWVRAADLDADGDTDVLSASSTTAATVAWYENDGSQNFTTHAITSAAVGAAAIVAMDVDADGDIDILSASQSDDKVAWYENRGGQFSLPTTDLAPVRSVDGATESILQIDAAHRGRSGDADVELVTFDLLLEATAGVSLTTAEANALIENLHVYLDDGSGTFEAGSDTLVTTIGTMSLTAGHQPVTFSDGDTNIQLAIGTPRTYFIVVDLTSNAHTQVPDNFRITHVTESTSTGEDAVHDIPVTLEGTLNVSSAVVEVNDAPVATADTAPVANEDSSLNVAAPGVLANDTDGDGESDPLTAVLSTGPTNAASFALNADGSYSYTPNAHFGGFDTFTYQASDGLATSSSVTVFLSVVPIADTPNLSVSDESGAVDTAISLSITASPVDTDGSETLSINITDVPTGATLSAGTDQGGGTWLLEPGDLSGLTITPPAGSDADFTLGVQATATETSNNDQASTSVMSLNVIVGAEDGLVIFADGFESGDTSAWSSTVTNPIVQIVTVMNEASYEPGVYRGRIHLRPMDFSEPASDIVYAIREREDQIPSFGFRVTRQAEGYTIRAWLSGANGALTTRVVTLPALPLELEFERAEASGSGNADGYLRAFVDGRPAGSLRDLGRSGR